MVVQCKRCLYTSAHPLGISFDDEGICSGCRIHEEKDRLDWGERFTMLEKLVEPYRRTDAHYDCIVPVSGANDSFFILDMVVNKLKLKPLVVSYNKYFNTAVGIANLARLRINFNVDFQMKNVDPRIAKSITRTSLYHHGNVYWHCLAGQTVFPVQTAVMMQIPLIIWGAHQGLEQVGMFSHEHEVEMSRRYRKDHDLFGIEANNLPGFFDDLSSEDVINYRYPAFSDIEAIGLRGIYLGNYVRWDPYAQHRKMVEEQGYEGMQFERSFDAYDHSDCYVYSNLHDVLKLYKHGYGKVTDQLCREIRHGRIDRNDAVQIAAAYESREPAHMDLFSVWLGVPEQSLKFVLNQHRNPKIWDEVEPNKWARKENITVPDKLPLNPLEYPNVRPEKEMADDGHGYITIGRGVKWPEAPVAPAGEMSWLT